MTNKSKMQLFIKFKANKTPKKKDAMKLMIDVF